MVHLVTGYAGYEHITSADQGSFNAAFFGKGQFVMEAGEQIKASIIDNNTVRVLDGDILMYGRHIRIPPDNYEDITITTGTAGKNRIDLICMTYEKNTLDGTEKAYIEVVKGAETEGIPIMPDCISGNILDGAEKNQMPLYNVTISGVALSDIACLFRTIPTYKSLAEEYEQKFIQACESHLGALGVIDTMDGIKKNEKEDQLAGALALKEFEDNITEALKGKANSNHFHNYAVSGHAHDDRYYTESEIDTKLAGKAPSSHTHNYAASSHTHDDRYYTESEIDTKLAGKAPSSHTHDDRYYTESEMDTKLAGKAASNHSHNYAATSHTHDALKIALNSQDNYFEYNNGEVNIGPYNNVEEYLKSISKSINGLTNDKLFKSGGTINGNLGINGDLSLTAGKKIKLGSTAYISNTLDNISEWIFANGVGVSISSGDNSWRAFRPTSDNNIALGSTNQRWQTVFAGSSAISTSDRNLKKDITPISDKYLEFFALLQPVSYRFIDGTSNRIHVGFISQDVEAAMEQVGLTDLDFAGFCRDKMQREVKIIHKQPKLDDSGNPIMSEWYDIYYEDVMDDKGVPVYIYSLRYEEFIAINTAVIQQQQIQIDDLSQRLTQLEEKVAAFVL